MSVDDPLAELRAEERSLSRERTRLQDRIDFIRAGGRRTAPTAQDEEQLRLLIEKERAVSERRKAVHTQIGELQ